MGGDANTVEKGEALEFAKTLKDKDHYGMSKLVVLGEVREGKGRGRKN